MKILIDLTDHCNAKCPLCSRYKRGNDLSPDDSVNRSQVTIDQFKKWFPTLEGIEQIYFQGSFGEPSLCNDILEIASYIVGVDRSCNKIKDNNTKLLMSTNGGTRNKPFWNRLGDIFSEAPQGSYVIWSIDGVKDTLQKYRVNVDYDKVIKNAREFIKTGGPAVWRMLVFKHNQHQVNKARTISKLMKFQNFTHTKVNNLYDYSGNGDGTYTYTHKGETHTLEQADDNNYTANVGTAYPDSEIRCRYGHGTSDITLRIDSRGVVHACCYHQSRLRFFYPDFYINNDPKPAVFGAIDNQCGGAGGQLQELYWETIIPLIEDQGGITSLSLDYNNLEKILRSPFYSKTLVQSWQGKSVCREYCGIKRYKKTC